MLITRPWGSRQAIRSRPIFKKNPASCKPVSYARICLNGQFQIQNSLLTTTPALITRVCKVCSNGCFNTLGCNWLRYTIVRFRFIRFEKANSHPYDFRFWSRVSIVPLKNNTSIRLTPRFPVGRCNRKSICLYKKSIFDKHKIYIYKKQW
jgi:hypothetical protein